MTTPQPYDPTIHTLITPADPEAPARERRLRELGLGDRPEQEFDEFAARLAAMADGPLAMVNFIGVTQQYFAGLYAPSVQPAGSASAAASSETGRTMMKTHGWCPLVVVRKKALVLDDVCAYPRFATNPVIGELGIRAYLGAPLIDEDTGIALGTICVVDTQQHQWGRPGLELIKSMAQEMTQRITWRQPQRS